MEPHKFGKRSWAVNITRLMRRLVSRIPASGIERVTTAYLEHALEQDGYGFLQHHYGLTRLTPDQSRKFLRLLNSHWHGHSDPMELARMRWSWWATNSKHYLGFGRHNLPADNPVFHVSHGGLQDAGQVQRLVRNGAQLLTFIHDLIPIRFPEYNRRGEDAHHHRRIRHACQYSTGIIVNSQATLKDLQSYAVEAGLYVPPCVVAPLGTRTDLVKLGATMSPPPAPHRPYFVIVGTIEPRKNHLTLLHCWRILVSRLGDNAPHLYVIGRRGWEYDDIVDMLEHCDIIKPFVHEIGQASDAELAGWIRGAQAMLFPSFSEGYGLPLAEALALGTPVIASDLPVFREIAGEIPDYVSAGDRDAWLAQVNAYMSSESPARAAQLERLKQFQPMTWTEHFRIVDDFINDLRLDQYRIRQRYQSLGRICATGFSHWKRPYLTPFLSIAGQAPTWRRGRGEPCEDTTAVWGMNAASASPASTSKLLHVEDGFIRSIGLGSDLARPWSIVLDRKGLYFDARQPNDLTELLNRTEFTPELLARARRLREQIVSAGITKYNGPDRGCSLQIPTGRQVVLVPGQVADDASMKYGTADLKTSEELLRQARAACPEGWLIYRPHPDVLTGNREGLKYSRNYCDAVDIHSSLPTLLDRVDEVHTLSSLVGFDALLRCKRVVTYGLPFYAGWGLTQDSVAQPFRERPLTLDQLVAGVLILYPLYWDWDRKSFTHPEVVVARFAQMLKTMPATGTLSMSPNPIRPLYRLSRWLRNVAAT